MRSFQTFVAAVDILHRIFITFYLIFRAAVEHKVSRNGLGDNKVEEMNRLKARNERRAQDSIEELEASVRRSKKQIAQLEEQLKEAKEIAFRAQRGTRPPS